MSECPELAGSAGVAGEAAEPPGSGTDDAVDVVVLWNIGEVFWVWKTVGGWGEAGVSRCQGSWRTSNLGEWWWRCLRGDIGDDEHKDDDCEVHDDDNSREFGKLRTFT